MCQVSNGNLRRLRFLQGVEFSIFLLIWALLQWRCLRYRLKHIEVIKPWRQIGGRKSVCSTGSVSALQTCAVHSRAQLQCKHKPLTAGVLSGVMNDGWTESCTNINSDVTYWRQSCRDVFTGSHRRHGSPPSRLSEQYNF